MNLIFPIEPKIIPIRENSKGVGFLEARRLVKDFGNKCGLDMKLPSSLNIYNSVYPSEIYSRIPENDYKKILETINCWADECHVSTAKGKSFSIRDGMIFDSRYNWCTPVADIGKLAKDIDPWAPNRTIIIKPYDVEEKNGRVTVIPASILVTPKSQQYGFNRTNGFDSNFEGNYNIKIHSGLYLHLPKEQSVQPIAPHFTDPYLMLGSVTPSVVSKNVSIRERRHDSIKGVGAVIDINRLVAKVKKDLVSLTAFANTDLLGSISKLLNVME